MAPPHNHLHLSIPLPLSLSTQHHRRHRRRCFTSQMCFFNILHIISVFPTHLRQHSSLSTVAVKPPPISDHKPLHPDP
ncbi:hypothetical protein Hanom_Chr01g00055081 [Helianthus anomalus]